jgi:hypothetical protein
VTAQKLFLEANLALESMRPLEALDLFERAEQQGYDADLCSGSRWTCYMLLGRFESAWQESDRISARGRPDPNRFWDGNEVDGRDVLIRCLHGLGDTLQFIRYARLLRNRVRSLTIEAQPSLKALLSRAKLADRVITWGEAEPLWNQQIEVIELPRVFRTTLESIPNHVPYLNVGPKIASEYHGSRPLRVGLVWSGSRYNPARCIALKQVASLFDIAEVRFFSFQADPERSQLRPWAEKVQDAYTGSTCTWLTAEKLNSVDLIITVDTMMAHLAGGAGRPVWTLLPFVCDWRWMLRRTDSPWYPTMRLFRQPQPGDWASVVEAVKEKLHRIVDGYPIVFPAPSELSEEACPTCCAGTPGKVK